jgi:hypothetical protein
MLCGLTPADMSYVFKVEVDSSVLADYISCLADCWPGEAGTEARPHMTIDGAQQCKDQPPGDRGTHPQTLTYSPLSAIALVQQLEAITQRPGFCMASKLLPQRAKSMLGLLLGRVAERVAHDAASSMHDGKISVEIADLCEKFGVSPQE